MFDIVEIDLHHTLYSGVYFRKYLRDAEKKYYSLMSFRYTLDAVEQQTNVMKVVTDSETRLKYLMTVHKIWEHGIHKLNKYVDKTNRLFAETYRVVLRKLEVGLRGFTDCYILSTLNVLKFRTLDAWQKVIDKQGRPRSDCF